MSSKTSPESALPLNTVGCKADLRILPRVAKLFRKLLLCADVRRERAKLLELSDRELLDIGIDRADARCEASRSFFDVPENRHQE